MQKSMCGIGSKNKPPRTSTLSTGRRSWKGNLSPYIIETGDDQRVREESAFTCQF